MSNPIADKSRITNQLASRVLDAVGNKLATKTNKAIPVGLMRDAVVSSRMRRFELLDLNQQQDMERLQMIYNDVERYEVVSQKVTTVKGMDSVDYRCIIEYNELGEGLPLVRVGSELRKLDAKKMKSAP